MIVAGKPEANVQKASGKVGLNQCSDFWRTRTFLSGIIDEEDKKRLVMVE